IGRHRRDRLRMTVRDDGKPAVTHYRLIERLPGVTYLSVQLETGRTHQIRVHMNHIGYPLVGDRQYAAHNKLPRKASPECRQAIRDFPRQALHAYRLKLNHPEYNETYEWEIPTAADIQRLVDVLRSE
ncbi:MAG: RNA pseudouridine synthase, partial [Gammaproteobacteria bacterium]|nr:RNA pseudouridine synthase [Gammaproteobacteria bacterium]